MHYEWDFSVVWQFRGALLSGLLTTLWLTLLSAFFGLVGGVALALCLTNRVATIRIPATLAVELIRAIPLPVALVYLYYVGPTLAGITLPSFTTSVLVFSVNFAAFAADVFRGSIAAIPRSHIDAAAALGMSRLMVLRRVVFAEAIRRSFPALNALLVSLLKLTSLAALINTPELVHVSGLIVSERPRVFEVYTAMAALYLAVIVPIVYLLRRLERSRWFALEPIGN